VVTDASFDAERDEPCAAAMSLVLAELDTDDEALICASGRGHNRAVLVAVTCELVTMILYRWLL
jgi:hypothetical protein